MAWSTTTARRQGQDLAATLALGFLMLSTGLVSTAAAQPAVDCGAVITKSTVLTTDIGPCPGVGIIVAADNVVLNLNGHTVAGNPQLRGNGPDDQGVLLRQVRGSTVMNGTIQGFDGGVV